MKIIEFPALFVENGKEVLELQDMGVETTIEERPQRCCLAFIDGHILEFTEDLEDKGITNLYIGETLYRVAKPYESFLRQLENLEDEYKER